MKDQGIPAEKIAADKKMMDFIYGNPLICWLFTSLFEPLAPGLLMSLVAAGVNHFKNKKEAQS